MFARMFQKIFIKNSQQGVVSLIAVLGVGLFAFGGVLTLSLMTMNGLAQNRHTIEGDQAFYAADAASREGVYQYLNLAIDDAEDTYVGGSFPLFNGVTTAAIEPPEVSGAYLNIRGAVTNGEVGRTAVNRILVFAEGLAFEYGVFSNEDLGIGGSSEINGSIFANGNIDMQGNGQVNGNAYAEGDIDDPDAISGDSNEGVDPIPPPQINPQPYRDAATSAGTFFNDDTPAENYVNNQTRTAVVFVEAADGDETRVQGNNTNLTGSLVVLGNLDINGGTFSASGNYAAVVVFGDLHIAGGTTVNGIVYVTGSTTFGGGNNIINGALISVGAVSVVDVSGNTTINYDEELATAWPDLAGLITESALPPRLFRWDEE